MGGAVWTFAVIPSICSCIVAALVPHEVRPCPVQLSENPGKTLALECAYFAVNVPQSEELGSDDVSCASCLADAAINVSNIQELAPQIRSCTQQPAVLYELQPLHEHRAHVMAACARPSCPVWRVLDCTGAIRPQRAFYWNQLAVLLPWRVAIPAVTHENALPPGAPPFGQHSCVGPPPNFYMARLGPPAWPAPHRCQSRTFYPISFGIPREDVVACLPKKIHNFASLVPGKMDTYIFPMTSFGEMEYKRMYREARYASSPRKGGWETMRIYEIFASGSVPFVGNVRSIPEGALAFLDKATLRLATALEGVDGARLQIEASRFNTTKYESLAADLLRHTQQRLTTEAIASYMLAAAGKQSASAVLFVANCGHGDYQCYLALHGLRRLLGEGLVDFPQLPYMYRPRRLAAMEELDRRMNCPQTLCTTLTGSYSRPIVRGYGQTVPVYGGGFSYGFRLEDVAINRSEAIIRNGIKNRKFDAVVFGNAELQEFHDDRAGRRLKALWDLVIRHYGPEDILIVDGRDPPKHSLFHEGVHALAARGHYFLREIPDEC